MPLATLSASPTRLAVRSGPLDATAVLLRRRLSVLRRLCLGLLASVAVFALAAQAAATLRPGAGTSGAGRPAGAPGGMGASLVLALLAMLLILGASRVQAAVAGQARAGLLAPPPEILLGAYTRSVLVGFLLLDVAAFLGLLIALLNGSPRYAWVLSAASASGMLVRWPRRRDAARLLARPDDPRERLP